MQLKIEYINIDDLTPYERNTRKHELDDVDQIAKSIEKFGFSDPIGIWSDKNIIVEGHGRLLAAKKLGMDSVPCIRLDHLSDEERREYAIAHNATAELSTWDVDMLELEMGEIDISDFDFDFDELNISGADFNAATEVKEVDVPDIPEVPKSHLGQIYQLGDHRLMVGDSTNGDDVAKLMNDNLADLLYTDPPYNVNIENSQGMTIENDDMDNGAFAEFLDAAFSNALVSMKDGAAFYVWYASREHINFENALTWNSLQVREQLIWAKNSFTFGRQDYKWQHEPCLYGWKGGAPHYFVDEHNHPTVFEDELDIDSLKKDEMRELLRQIYASPVPTTVFHENKPLKNDLHPTMKPIKLCAQMIRNSSKKGDIVLDLFGGSGSTLIACEQLGRMCYTMEYDPIYADVIIERWEKLTGKKAVLIND